MKTLQDIEADVARLATRVGAFQDDLPTYGTSRDAGHPHVEVDAGLYHYVIVERGQEIDRRSSADYDDLLYWIFEYVTFNLAFSYEQMHRIEDQDCRRIAFPRQIELMRRLGPDMGKRMEREIARILERAPYDDELTKAANRMSRRES
ncbi:Imm63 family immunity protein [Bradyrhizobium sp. WSM1743]|uniref:Imm63 family immunity protein n=1 Tax=Bradyrhizobium sp. WSM1743 TaxID=318996 RepID=UPI00040B0D94|nr:Imm63 family immunity protein [Bradyrhizobium sp. WSM1743]